MKLYTARYSYPGPDRVDTTVKTSDGIFAPTWDMVMNHKKGKLSDAGYTEMYYSMMRRSYVENHKAWDALLARERAVIVCFCPYGKFCHRHLLRDMLVKCGAEFQDEIVYHNKLWIPLKEVHSNG